MINRKKRKQEQARILVEWICRRCNRVHRISFPYRVTSVVKRIRINSRPFRQNRARHIQRLHIDYGVTYTQLNDFLTKLFSDQFDATEYVKISYPERLLYRLKMNEH